MTNLDSLHNRCNIAVIGASGGIGSAFVKCLANDDGVAAVHAFSRSPQQSAHPKVTCGVLDLSEEASIAAAAQAAAAQSALDLVVVATGILHRETSLTPEKTLRAFDRDAMLEVMEVNSIGPALVAKHFLPRLVRQRKAVFAVLSARVGSIADNRLGGWAGYRMSQAALNMLVRTVAIEQTRASADAVVVALHPGTVDTALSAPFSGRVESAKLFSAEQSVARLIGTINALQVTDTGGFFAYDGSRIDF
jgi:NAD(P)-dependent dehydrogenase (short-subunit alcohol dehydrogenase family)